jgi:hypothetical protein
VIPLRSELVFNSREFGDDLIEQGAEVFTMQAQDFDVRLSVHKDSSLLGDVPLYTKVLFRRTREKMKVSVLRMRKLYKTVR